MILIISKSFWLSWKTVTFPKSNFWFPPLSTFVLSRSIWQIKMTIKKTKKFLKLVCSTFFTKTSILFYDEINLWRFDILIWSSTLFIIYLKIIKLSIPEYFEALTLSFIKFYWIHKCQTIKLYQRRDVCCF